MKNEAIILLQQAIQKIKGLSPVPSSDPGPLMNDAGRAYEALTSAQTALDWLTGV